MSLSGPPGGCVPGRGPPSEGIGVAWRGRRGWVTGRSVGVASAGSLGRIASGSIVREPRAGVRVRAEIAGSLRRATGGTENRALGEGVGRAGGVSAGGPSLAEAGRLAGAVLGRVRATVCANPVDDGRSGTARPDVRAEAGSTGAATARLGTCRVDRPRLSVGTSGRGPVGGTPSAGSSSTVGAAPGRRSRVGRARAGVDGSVAGSSGSGAGVNEGEADMATVRRDESAGSIVRPATSSGGGVGRVRIEGSRDRDARTGGSSVGDAAGSGVRHDPVGSSASSAGANGAGANGAGVVGRRGGPVVARRPGPGGDVEARGGGGTATTV